MVKAFRKSLNSFFLAFMVIVYMIISKLPIVVNAIEEGKTIHIIEITDFHGSMEDSSVPPYAVAPVLAKNIKDIKTENPNRTLILGGGDMYQGSPISNVLSGVPVQKFLSNIGMEVTALGNHELDWTLSTINNVTMKDAKYSILCANIYNEKTGNRVYKPYKIITKDGIKIGVIGAITLETPNIVKPAIAAGYCFTDPTIEINKLVPMVKTEGAQVIIALLHEGSDDRGETGPIVDITKALVGVNAVFGGHSHTEVHTLVNKTPIYIANSYGRGFIDAKMEVNNKGIFSFQTPSPSDYVAIDNTNAKGYKAISPIMDKEVKKIYEEARVQVGHRFDEIIGTTHMDLTDIQDEVPYGESYLGNWAADVIRLKAKADVGLINNGGLRVNINKGKITLGTLFYFMPFDNEINVVTMNKEQLKAVLEQAFNTFSHPKNPKNTIGGKGIQVSGIKVKYDSKKPYGSAVLSITREDDTPIGDSDKLRVAITDFMADGGDGFIAFTDGKVKGTLQDEHVLVRDAMIENIRANKTIKTVMNKRLVN